MTVLYVLIGVGVLLLLLFLISKKGNSEEPKLDDLNDELIYDPESGESMSMEDAMSEKAWGDDGTTPTYDVARDVEEVFELIEKKKRIELDVETTKVVLQIQEHYTKSGGDDVGSEDNIAFIKEVFINNQLEPLPDEQLNAIITAEQKFMKEKGIEVGG